MAPRNMHLDQCQCGPTAFKPIDSQYACTFMKFCGPNSILDVRKSKTDNGEPEARLAYDPGSDMPMWYAKIREVAPGAVIRIKRQK